MIPPKTIPNTVGKYQGNAILTLTPSEESFPFSLPMPSKSGSRNRIKAQQSDFSGMRTPPSSHKSLHSEADEFENYERCHSPMSLPSSHFESFLSSEMNYLEMMFEFSHQVVDPLSHALWLPRHVFDSLLGSLGRLVTFQESFLNQLKSKMGTASLPHDKEAIPETILLSVAEFLLNQVKQSIYSPISIIHTSIHHFRFLPDSYFVF